MTTRYALFRIIASLIFVGFLSGCVAIRPSMPRPEFTKTKVNELSEINGVYMNRSPRSGAEPLSSYLPGINPVDNYRVASLRITALNSDTLLVEFLNDQGESLADRTIQPLNEYDALRRSLIVKRFSGSTPKASSGGGEFGSLVGFSGFREGRGILFLNKDRDIVYRERAFAAGMVRINVIPLPYVGLGARNFVYERLNDSGP